MAKTSMPISRALDYSVGRAVTAAQAAPRRLREAVEFSQWTDRALGLSRAIQQLSSPHPTAILRIIVAWNEKATSSDPADQLRAAISSAQACLSAISDYVVRQAKRSERWDVIFAAIEDGNVAVADLRAALNES